MAGNEHTRAGERRRARADSGAALVEFALVSVLLLTIVFAIINFGLILSFKQDMTRAAAEGARAGAVAMPGDALAQASTATNEAVQGFDRKCDEDGDGNPTAFEDTDGMVCNVTLGACEPVPAAADPPQCVTVELVYDYEAFPLLAKMPLISAFLPDQIRDSSVARLNS
jgi:Flp pilus assembly protein TadG